MSKQRTLARSHRVGRARRPRVSVWQQLNQGREIGLGLFGNKHFVLGIVLIALAMGAIVLAQGPLFHSYEVNPNYHGEDPFTTVWSDGFASSDLSGYNCNRASYVSSPAKGIQLASDANGPAICVSKSTMDLSTASGKEIEFDMLIDSITTNKEFGWFLTRNGTIPAIGTPDAAYNPATDPNVALYLRMTNQGSQSVLHNLLIQRVPTVSLATDQYPNCQGGSETGVCYMVTTFLWFAGPPIFDTQRLILNFTGSTAAGGNSGKSFLDAVSASALPWFAFQAQPYYIGFFTVTGSSTQQFLSGPNSQPTNTISVGVGLPIIPSAPVVTPNIDTGGFFGPVIRAFMSIGVFIIQNILSFAVYLYNILAPIGAAIFNLAASGLATIIAIFYNVVKTILNSIGSILGLGTLGDNLFQLLTGLADWFTTFFGTIINIAFSGNLVNALSQILTFNVTLLVPYWTLLTAWFTALGDYLSLFWSTVSLFSKISVSMLLSFWLLYGALRFSRSMASGMEWYHTTGYFTMLGVSITWYFLVIIINYVIIPIVHIITAGSTTLGARPKIEVAGTSTP